MEFKGTKGKFKDGTTGWKAVAYGEGDKVGYSTHEIHWSDDGECVAEVVHEEANAKLAAAAPELLDALQYFLEHGENRHSIKHAEKAIEKALN